MRDETPLYFAPNSSAAAIKALHLTSAKLEAAWSHGDMNHLSVAEIDMIMAPSHGTKTAEYPMWAHSGYFRGYRFTPEDLKEAESFMWTQREIPIAPSSVLDVALHLAEQRDKHGHDIGYKGGTYGVE